MSNTKAVGTLVSLLFLSSACSDFATPPQLVHRDVSPSSIVNGEPTGAAYGSVGALLFDFDKNGVGGEDEWCTGSLIAPDVFLSAHCVVTPFTPPGSQFYVSFSPDDAAEAPRGRHSQRTRRQGCALENLVRERGLRNISDQDRATAFSL